jgi:hypothetical protein
MMGNDCTNDNLNQIIDRVFRSHEDISYIAIANDKLKVIAHRGFIELHPSKLQILHVQAALLVNMSSVWSELLGNLDYTFASFDSRSEIVAMPISNKLHLVAILSSVHKKDLAGIRSEIIKQFKSISA